MNLLEIIADVLENPVGATVDVGDRTGTVRDLYCKGQDNALWAETALQ